MKFKNSSMKNHKNLINKKNKLLSFEQLIFTLQKYWNEQGCAIVQPIDIEVGAGTSHPMTYLRAIGPEPISVAYVQPSRRPTDGCYGKNTSRLQHYYQFQVIMKPSPKNIQDLYFNSLVRIGINLKINDIKFIADNWENPTLGAWGIGWEVWLNGMEITQFTYFQQVGGLNCSPITGEITYGLERLSMQLQEIENVYDIIWSNSTKLTYGEIFLQNEKDQSAYNFQHANIDFLIHSFHEHLRESKKLIKLSKIFPAYEQVLKAIHIFNLLSSRKVIAHTESKYYIFKIRSLVKSIAALYYNFRKSINFPMCKNKSNYNEKHFFNGNSH